MRRASRAGRAAAIVLALSVLAACSAPADDLERWGLFADAAAQAPADGVIPFEPISQLFSDYSTKHRFLRVPPGDRIGYTADGDWVFPEGTVLAKTFGYLADLRDPSAGERLIETRLLSLEDGEWVPYVYLWDEAQTSTTRVVAGARVDVSWVHLDGVERSLEYRVPNAIQCANCHGGSAPLTPIGPRTAQLDHAIDYGQGPENQIDHLAGLGLFSGAVQPPAERRAFVDPFGDGDLDARARAYLDANCAHCHSETGAASQSGLWLGADIDDPVRLGFCKRPVAAGRGAGGRSFDVVPGAPDESVIPFRMASEEPGIKMPELPSLLSHAEGVALIEEWIAGLTPTGCQ